MADERKGTKYIVLRRMVEPEDGPNIYMEVGWTEANNDMAAIDAVAKDFPDEDWSRGAIAVPARSFRLRVPEEKVTRRRLWS